MAAGDVNLMRPGSLLSGDHQNIRTTVDIYRVEAIPLFVPPILGQIGTNGVPLPNYNDPHPHFAGLVVDQIDIDEWGDNTAKVYVRYSNNRSWAKPDPPPDPTAPGINSWSRITDIEDDIVPIAVREPLEVVVPNQAPVVKRVWGKVEFKVQGVRSIIEVRKSLGEHEQGTVDFDYIEEETNKLHTIGGRSYLFLGAACEQLNATRWEIRYRWRYDRGTLRPADWPASGAAISPFDDFAYPTSQAKPPLAPTIAGEYIRHPFTEIYLIPPDDIEFGTPTWVASKELYRRNPNGWQGLPGGPT